MNTVDLVASLSDLDIRTPQYFKDELTQLYADGSKMGERIAAHTLSSVGDPNVVRLMGEIYRMENEPIW